jgi:hypothetical protein
MIELGIDPKIVADLMGHDVNINLNVYASRSPIARSPLIGVSRTRVNSTALLPAELRPAGKPKLGHDELNGDRLETSYLAGRKGLDSKSKLGTSNSPMPAWEDVRSEGFHQKQSTYELSSRSAVIPYCGTVRAQSSLTKQELAKCPSYRHQGSLRVSWEASSWYRRHGLPWYKTSR